MSDAAGGSHEDDRPFQPQAGWRSRAQERVRRTGRGPAIEQTTETESRVPCEPTTDGVPMRVLVPEPAGGSLARCADAEGGLATVETALVGAVERGDVVLVHAGVALVRLDAEWIP